MVAEIDNERIMRLRVERARARAAGQEDAVSATLAMLKLERQTREAPPADRAADVTGGAKAAFDTARRYEAGIVASLETWVPLDIG